MLKWTGIVLVALIVWGATGYLRHTYLPRRRIDRFLRARGVDFVRITGAFSYAWPSYVVLFESLEKSSAFSASPTFAALVAEVRSMHGNLKHGEVSFDASAAVSVAPNPLLARWYAG